MNYNHDTQQPLMPPGVKNLLDGTPGGAATYNSLIAWLFGGICYQWCNWLEGG